MAERYTVSVDPTGCYAPGNPSRAELGQEAEELEVLGTMAEAIDAIGPLRSGDVFDEWGDCVARVTYHGKRRVYDKDGEEIHT